MASGQLLNDIVGDFVELQGILDTPISIKHRMALTHVAGQLALLVGWFVIDFGELRNAQAWFHTAGLAAGEVRDGQLTGSVLVWSAVANLYNGAPENPTRPGTVHGPAGRHGGACEYALGTVTAVPPAHQELTMHYGRGF